jgi:carbonic anhydrase
VSAFDDLLHGAAAHHARFSLGHLDRPPARGLAVVTCMDARIDPLQFGLAPGDAGIIRNAGARVTDDVMRSLVVAAARLGVRRVAVIQHTDCGVVGVTNLAVADKVLEVTGHDPAGMDFGCFDDQRAALLEDVKRLASSHLLPAGTVACGFLYDVKTGELTQVTDERVA